MSFVASCVRRLHVLRALLEAALGLAAWRVITITLHGTLTFVVFTGLLAALTQAAESIVGDTSMTRLVLPIKHAIALLLTILFFTFEVVAFVLSRHREFRELRKQDPALFTAIQLEITKVIRPRSGNGQSS